MCETRHPFNYKPSSFKVIAWISSLGEPRQMAQKKNRVHLGKDRPTTIQRTELIQRTESARGRRRRKDIKRTRSMSFSVAFFDINRLLVGLPKRWCVVLWWLGSKDLPCFTIPGRTVLPRDSPRSFLDASGPCSPMSNCHFKFRTCRRPKSSLFAEYDAARRQGYDTGRRSQPGSAISRQSDVPHKKLNQEALKETLTG